ncbi:MAG: Gfo/Idh/MocA family protein [Promethearchaeota archaeon]
MGLIGTGAIAHAHLEAYLKFPEKIKLNAICDIQEEAIKKFSKHIKVENSYTDFSKMLKDADIDAVDICTINDQHKILSIEAAEQGKHVFLEKPMSTSLKNCYEMVNKIDKTDVTFMIGQDLRYSPYSQGVLKLLREDELGQIRTCRYDSIMNQVRVLPSGHWMFDGKRTGGGVLINLTIHGLDLLRYFVGEVKKVTAFCKTINPTNINGAEDFANVTLEFENNAVGSVYACNSTARTPWNMRYMIFGDHGCVYSLPPSIERSVQQIGRSMISSRKQDNNGKTKYRGEFIPIEPIYEGLQGDNPFTNELLHFAECCREDKEPLTSGKENLGTMKIIFGIYESSRTGNSVNLRDL